MDHTTTHIIVKGRVQGVGYRAWTKANARKRGLKGWVRNLGDKSVEAVFSGPADVVQEMVETCREGPLACRVLDLATAPYEGQTGDDFEIAETV